MSIVIKVRQVRRLYEMLERELDVFKRDSGLHCLPGCGHCCTKPNIEAAVLEFLPYAFQLFQHRQAESVKDQLQSDLQPICHLFRVMNGNDYVKGRCMDYENRGLICRLFGFSTSRDKNGNRVLSTCKWIKNSQEHEIAISKELIAKGTVPHITSYYQKLVQIDFRLGQEYLPINKAILRAIQEVEKHYQYRPFPYGKKSA